MDLRCDYFLTFYQQKHPLHGLIDLFYLINIFPMFRAVTTLIKSTVRPSKPTVDELPMTRSKPTVYPRPSATHTMSRSMTVSSTESPHIPQSDSTNEFLRNKPSMSTSLYSASLSNEQKDTNNSTESISLSPPPVADRVGKAGIGTRVLPAPNAHGDGPTVKLRHIHEEKKSKR